MKIIRTEETAPDKLAPWERSQVYNGLDCCVTRELIDILEPQLDEVTSATYDFERELQGPVLEMRLRGVLIDQERREQVIEEYYNKLDQLERQLDRLVGEGFDVWRFNWRSNKDLHYLFYDVLGIPPVTRGGRPTVNRDALERIEEYFSAKQVVKHIKAMRDLGKKMSMLKTEIDSDGRMRTSYNIAGTTTGRLSSSFSEFGTGTNLQNIEESLRSVFVADRGKKLAYLDAEQGESRVVGAIQWNLFKDGRYLDTCESGDLHTSVARLVWANYPWTGNLKQDRALAEQPYYRHYDRRFMCKKVGHGTNYIGKPRTLANEAKVEIGMIEDFQPKYFRAFPALLRWHVWTERQIRENGFITSIMGRKRWFFGRRTDDETYRQAAAYQGQALADILDRGMLNVWRRRDCELLMQIHDAILVQYAEEAEDEVIPRVIKALEYPVPLNHNRTLIIPYGVKTGWNWGAYSKDNPDGLKTYAPGDKRRRAPEVGFMDRKFYKTYR